MKFLFVGGIANGRFLEVPPLNPDDLKLTYPPTYQVSIEHLELPFQYSSLPVEPQIVSRQVHQYTRANLYSGNQIFHIYTAGDRENIIYDLISGYAQLYNELVNIRDN